MDDLFVMPPRPLPNVDELDAVLDHVAAHPEEWDQDVWCGSACCIAGHIAKRAGFEVTGRGYVRRDREIGARPTHVADVAEEILGVSHPQAVALFANTNKLSTLRTMAAALRADPHAFLENVR